MKTLIRIVLFLLVLLLILAGAGYMYLRTSAPQYSGTLDIEGLSAQVEVIYDQYGIPHIYAENETDLYLALGFVHAQDRLFQMEMIRRVASGQMAEIVGPDFVETDAFFRTLGIAKKAHESAAQFKASAASPYKKAAEAYLKGINQFIDKGKLPIEFSIMGIQPSTFVEEDMYLVSGYLAFGFAAGFRTDPLLEDIHRKLGPAYFEEIGPHYVEGNYINPSIYPDKDKADNNSEHKTELNTSLPSMKVNGNTINHQEVEKGEETERKDLSKIAERVSAIVDQLPVPLLIGSNSWVIGPDKTESGQVILCNDTHIMYSQPAVWYEAHLNCPGFQFHGLHLAGLPFGVIGNNNEMAVGLTMFENDDLDFYIERAKPDEPNLVWVNDQWKAMDSRQERIRVKGQNDTLIIINESRHGPIINSVIPEVKSVEPVSVWWSYLHLPNNSLEALYQIGHATSFEAVKSAVKTINAPGLNVMYGDAKGNIAWWAAAKLNRRPAHADSKLFLDGASGKDEMQGWHDFSHNPQVENPSVGYVLSANTQNESTDGSLYPGYYFPGSRAKRIKEMIDRKAKLNPADMERMFFDDRAQEYVQLTQEILTAIGREIPDEYSPIIMNLLNWDGRHGLGATAPTVFNKLLYHILHDSMADEIGEEAFTVFLTTYMQKRTLGKLIPNEESVWWDNVETTDVKEKRTDIFISALKKTKSELEEAFGKDTKQWTWNKIHFLTHNHPLGEVKPLDKIFNVGPFPMSGGNGVLNVQGFSLTAENRFETLYGPAMRILIDFSDMRNSKGVLPTGQSGNIMSPHYADQAPLFNKGKLRPWLMDRTDIEAAQKTKLILN